MSILLIYNIIANNKNKNKTFNISYKSNNNITLFGGNNDSTVTDNNFVLPKRFPQVGVLTNKVFNTYTLDDFVWLEKTDGEHINLLIMNKQLYYVNYGNKELFISKYSSINDKQQYSNIIDSLHNIIKQLPNTITLLDCELYNDKLYVFDACIVDNVYIDKLNYMCRISKAKEYINEHKLNNVFIVKNYYVIDKDKFNELLNYIYNNDVSKYTNNYVDGAIFQLINKPYFDKLPISYKIKKRCLNTIDFLLKYDKHNDIFLLYLSGDIYDNNYNTQYLVHEHNNISTNISTSYNKYYQTLFASPLYDDVHYYKVSNEWNKKGYSPRLIQEINNIIGDIRNNKEQYNNTIVEMSLTEDNKWVPMRIRKDKRYPNGYKVGLSNCGTMFSPISTDVSYFNKDMSTSPFTEQTRSDYHDINKIVRKHIIKTIFDTNINDNNKHDNISTNISTSSQYDKYNDINKYNNISNSSQYDKYNDINKYNNISNSSQHDNISDVGYNMLLDLCGGRGGDINNIIEASNNTIDNFFVVDADKPAIVQYTERMDPHKYINDNKTRYVKGYYHVLNDDEQETTAFINKIKSSSNYVNKEGFSIILMNYAIHYISNKRSCLLQLKRIVKELLKHNGIFAFTYFDGDKILKSLTKYNKLISFDEKTVIKTFKDIKIVNKQSDSDNDSISCLMALPTIDAKGYREEPLVFQNFLNVLEDKDLKFKTFVYPVQELIKNNELEHNDITNYLEYVKLCIMIKS